VLIVAPVSPRSWKLNASALPGNPCPHSQSRVSTSRSVDAGFPTESKESGFLEGTVPSGAYQFTIVSESPQEEMIPSEHVEFPT